ncbi:MAG: hypothetical protein R6U88_01420 [Candidatus Bipolaricaulota bacterium]
MLLELIRYAATAIAPTIILVNYVFVALGGGLMEVMLVEVGIALGSIGVSFLIHKIPRRHGFKAMAFGGC